MVEKRGGKTMLYVDEFIVAVPRGIVTNMKNTQPGQRQFFANMARLK